MMFIMMCFHSAAVPETMKVDDSRRMIATRRLAAVPAIDALVWIPGPMFERVMNFCQSSMSLNISFTPPPPLKERDIRVFLPVAKFRSPSRKQQEDIITVRGFAITRVDDRNAVDE